ncbi:Rha family transcriptional regulator [Acinetobacter nosocomialis]|uniref:Rha family transcriptional regulator n=1 Tax=Acinetobacter nosocomialis TaxID=106654 RepID=UPI001F1B657B|nr:Rha family transcriptional regulator [Acinetobacter nosocomialis]MCF1297081.1 Rha family transcriptional regulator [Acinetobacter nosocomialis]
MSNLTTNFNTQTAIAISLKNLNKVQTMSSKEIAELTGKEHFNVKRDIENMLSQLNLDTFKFEDIFLDSMNRTQKGYALNKDLTLCLVSGYNVKLRMAIINRWTELEAQLLEMARPSYMIENPIERAKKWIEEERAKQAIEIKLHEVIKVNEIQAPKAEVFDAVLDKSLTYSIREFAQRTGIKEKEVKKWIVEKRWATGTDSKTFRPAAWSNVNNYMRMVKQGKIFTDKWGIQHCNEVIVFTQDGFNEAVRKMVKSGMMKPLAQDVR